MQIRVAGAQMAVTNDVDANVATLLRAVDFAAAQDAAVLLTPEGSLSGYRHDFDRPAVADALAAVTAAAAARGVGLALGTCWQEDDGLCYNQLRFYDPAGTHLGFHAKVLRCSAKIGTDPILPASHSSPATSCRPYVQAAGADEQAGLAGSLPMDIGRGSAGGTGGATAGVNNPPATSCRPYVQATGADELSLFAGAPLRSFELCGLRVGGLICNDMWADPQYTAAADEHLSQRHGEAGVRVIFHAVNGGRCGDEWSRQVVWPYHEANLRMRAAAARVWIVTADNCWPSDVPCSSPSGVIDPAGRWACRAPDQGEHFFAHTIEL